VPVLGKGIDLVAGNRRLASVVQFPKKMPGGFSAGFRALDKQNGPGCSHGATHTLQHGAFRPFDIASDELRVAELAGLDQFIDGYSANTKLSSGWIVSMPDKTCRGQVIRDSNYGVASALSGSSFEQLDIDETIDLDVAPEGFDISRNRLKRDHLTAGSDLFRER
jgi:hypothetical protein